MFCPFVSPSLMLLGIVIIQYHNVEPKPGTLEQGHPFPRRTDIPQKRSSRRVNVLTELVHLPELQNVSLLTEVPRAVNYKRDHQVSTLLLASKT